MVLLSRKHNKVIFAGFVTEDNVVFISPAEINLKSISLRHSVMHIQSRSLKEGTVQIKEAQHLKQIDINTAFFAS